MFTGMIEEVGRVRAIQRRAGYRRTTVDASRVLEDMQVGDSITLDGACQTVVALDGPGFTVESVEETLRRTTLGRKEVGDRINLERALRLDGRLGGHLVAGHVDGVGRMLERREAREGAVFRIGVPEGLSPYVAEKGSIAVDGISLTVASASGQDFTVAVIPHTLQATTLSERRTGDAVNLEVDMVARYLERLLRAGQAPGKGGLTESALRQMGY